MTAASLLQICSTSLLNLGFAWLLGACLCMPWVMRSPSEWQAHELKRLAWSAVPAAALCLAANLAALWAAAAVMGDTALPDAGNAFIQALSSTSLGHAGLAGLAVLTVFLGFAALRLRQTVSPGSWRFCLALLFLFALTRAGSSHAAEQGWLSIAMLSEWLHLLAMGSWAGIVLVAGWLLLPDAAPLVAAKRQAAQALLSSISFAATVALATIVLTGLYNAWRGLGVVQNLVGNPYGTALLVKLALVLGAVGLGAYNRFIGFPAVPRAHAGGPTLQAALYRAISVLRFESALLLGAIVAAAFLASQAPPGFE